LHATSLFLFMRGQCILSGNAPVGAYHGRRRNVSGSLHSAHGSPPACQMEDQIVDCLPDSLASHGRAFRKQSFVRFRLVPAFIKLRAGGKRTSTPHDAHAYLPSASDTTLSCSRSLLHPRISTAHCSCAHSRFSSRKRSTMSKEGRLVMSYTTINPCEAR
jgi:hypothetical protein